MLVFSGALCVLFILLALVHTFNASLPDADTMLVQKLALGIVLAHTLTLVFSVCIDAENVLGRDECL